MDVEEEIANHLISQGYSSLEELAYIGDEEFDSVENIESEMLTQIRNKARDSLLLDAMLDETENSDTDSITSKTFSELDKNIHKILADANIKTLSELADFSIDELQEVCEVDEDLAGKIIMQAREPFLKTTIHPMSEILISKFAEEIGLPAELLLEKLKAAGIDKSGQSDSLSQKDKMKLLNFLRGSSSTSSSANNVPKKKMTEIKKVSNLGKTRTIEIKVKTKKTIPQKIIKDSVKKQVESARETSKRSWILQKLLNQLKQLQNLEQKNQVESEITSVKRV